VVDFWSKRRNLHQVGSRIAARRCRCRTAGAVGLTVKPQVSRGFRRSQAMDALSRNWGWLLALAIIMILLGLMAIATPVYATFAVQVLLGWILVIGGIAHGIHAFTARGWGGVVLELLSALLYLAVGALLLVNPVEGALALTIVLAAFLVVEGIFKIVMAWRVRAHPRWGWLLASGILSLVLGALIWAQWPSSGLWVIGLLVGVHLLFTGWALIMLALAARAWREASVTAR
jgi:uncharacterized membrane protein HdeD (DUF308 family)